MTDDQTSAKQKLSTDWLARGVLTKLGDAFDRLTGRSYRPSSSLATSELIEKLKKLLDHEVREGRFVPHNINLKMQWDKFSTDSSESLERLENELKIAVVDHINDRRYHTYAPINLRVKPDYFTEGVKLLVSFDKFDAEDNEVAVNVTVPQVKVGDYLPELAEPAEPEREAVRFAVSFAAAGKNREMELEFGPNTRVSVGRGAENGLVIDDPSVSKMHASIIVNSDDLLAVADTGSTNGTFIAGSRIAYGKAIPVGREGMIRFGTIDVSFTRIETESVEDTSDAPTEAFQLAPATVVPATRIEVIPKIEPEPAKTITDDPTSDRIVLEFDKEEK